VGIKNSNLGHCVFFKVEKFVIHTVTVALARIAQLYPTLD
jgi:hypothetical protein